MSDKDEPSFAQRALDAINEALRHREEELAKDAAATLVRLTEAARTFERSGLQFAQAAYEHSEASPATYVQDMTALGYGNSASLLRVIGSAVARLQPLEDQGVLTTDNTIRAKIARLTPEEFAAALKANVIRRDMKRDALALFFHGEAARGKAQAHEKRDEPARTEVEADGEQEINLTTGSATEAKIIGAINALEERMKADFAEAPPKLQTFINRVLRHLNKMEELRAKRFWTVVDKRLLEAVNHATDSLAGKKGAPLGDEGLYLDTALKMALSEFAHKYLKHLHDSLERQIAQYEIRKKALEEEYNSKWDERTGTLQLSDRTMRTIVHRLHPDHEMNAAEAARCEDALKEWNSVFARRPRR